MKRKLFFVILLSMFSLSITNIKVHAQTDTASDSAITPELTNFPTLFPTVTPVPTISTAFPLLDQLDALANQSSTTSAQSTDEENPEATISAIPTPDMVA